MYQDAAFAFFIMEDRRERLRNLDSRRRRLPHTTASAFEALSREHNAEMSRHTLRAARDARLNTPTEQGAILKRLTLLSKFGLMLPLLIACPIASLFTACSQPSSFQRHFVDCLQQKPPSPEAPWSIVRSLALQPQLPSFLILNVHAETYRKSTRMNFKD